jgi:nicotinamide mononucleotide adenylyltransferase
MNPKIPLVTVHGRFQPPLHVNHFDYISHGFDIAEKVRILITNPDLKESSVVEASHRNKSENNPFTYDERVEMFGSFFDEYGIPESRYEFKPFDITDEAVWSLVLDKHIPNLINTYGSPWSAKKLELFNERGYPVIHLNNAKKMDVSGTKLREVIFSSLSNEEKKKELISIGYMKEAIPGLFKVLEKSKKL